MRKYLWVNTRFERPSSYAQCAGRAKRRSGYESGLQLGLWLGAGLVLAAELVGYTAYLFLR